MKRFGHWRLGHRKSLIWPLLCAALVLAHHSRTVHAQSTTIPVPELRGDQLLFFYDSRSGRIPFINVGNSNDSEVRVEVAVYDEKLAAPLTATQVSIDPAGTRTIDLTAEPFKPAGEGAFGLVVITPLASPTDLSPRVLEQPLMGSYTLANTTLNAAYGENAFGRFAVDAGTGARATPGQTVDGATVKFQRFTPSILAIPTFFNPNILEAPEKDGNRLVLAAFTDVYESGKPFRLASQSLVVRVTMFSRSGARIAAPESLQVAGVQSQSLQEVAGSAAVASNGSLYLSTEVGSGNLFGLFSQALGTFASSGRLVSAAVVPMGQGSPSPTPAPTPTISATRTSTPSPTPTGPPVCGNGVVEGTEECDGSAFSQENSSCAARIGGDRCSGQVRCDLANCRAILLECKCSCAIDLVCRTSGICEAGFCRHE